MICKLTSFFKKKMWKDWGGEREKKEKKTERRGKEKKGKNEKRNF